MAHRNIFADSFEADEATVLALRSDIARAIRKATDGLKQKDAAKRLKIAQGDLSKIRNGHIDALSLERLIKLCVRLGIDCAAQWGRSPNAAIAVQGNALELARLLCDAASADAFATVPQQVDQTWVPKVAAEAL